MAVVHSPKISYLVKLTNTPSDNFFAEMLLKGLGASFGGAGTTAAGAAWSGSSSPPSTSTPS